ncbi:CshA/CshB family fibrillar adhesin-related protein [Leucobacter luti]|uniref:CshA/CshB family fibrillar adhesin-related protein n=1 Tax=Leucobacter luti TaxID=340320 RepID=UPI0018E518BD|nr:CshA/CshB family fibrillar adhesin-related protein [Leucobacter luti]
MTQHATAKRRIRLRRAAAFVASIAVVASGLTFVPGLSPVAPAQAEFAEGGQGEHRNSIDWFSFGEAGVPIADGASYTNERVIGDGRIVSTCSINSIAGAISTYRPGDFQGDGLPYLYYQGGPGGANTMVNGITTTNFASRATFDFACEASYFDENNVETPIPLQGLVVADAESSSIAVGSNPNDEYIQVDPRPANSATWRVIDRMRSAGCSHNGLDPQETVLATKTAEGGMKFAPKGYECVGWSSAGYGPMAVGFMQGATAAHVTLQGGGHSAVALGMVLSIDFGDAPASFGPAGAIFQPEWVGTEITSTAGQDIWASDFELAVPTVPALHLGEQIDAEVQHQFSWDALLDDESGSPNDEDAIAHADLPEPKDGWFFNAASLDAEAGDPLRATCVGDGWVAGWLDWNQNGRFDADEMSDPAHCEGSGPGTLGAVDLVWPGLDRFEAKDQSEQPWAPVVYLRLRIANTVDDLLPTGVQVPGTGVTSAGEVEDYALGVPLIQAYKESDPLSGTPVLPGEEVEYSLVFHNTGEVPGEIVYDDFIAGVLDNAELVSVPATATGTQGSTIAVARIDSAEGPRIQLTGTLEKGESVEITYSVRVHEDATGGDQLDNFLLHVDRDSGGGLLEEIPESCTDDNPRCTTHPILDSELQVVKKTLPGDGQPVAPGAVITYYLDFDNFGLAPAEQINYVDDLSGLVDLVESFTVDNFRVIGDPLTLALEGAPDAPQLRVTGTLPGNGHSRVQYALKVKDPLPNPLPEGVTAIDNCIAEEGGAAELASCVTHPLLSPELELSKTADPESGTLVGAGQLVTYRLGFSNTGTAPATVNHSDDLSEVLDDADFVEVVDDGGLTVTGPSDGKLAITGALAAGASAEVVYTVRVKAEGERGDDTLANFLLPAGETPPPTCDPETGLCTTHPAGDPKLTLAKTSVPASGTPVEAGAELAYTLTFSNAEGKAEAAIDHVDDLSDVLDDATFGTVTSDGGLTVSGPTNDALSITGTLAAGAEASVTYTVTVDDPVAGNGTLANFLLEDGEEPGTCEPGDPCTVHPVPQLTVEKLVDVGSGTPVRPGDEPTYTLRFDNALGTAPATVAYVDDLSGVVDDATFIEASLQVPDGLTAVWSEDDATITVTGEVPAGAQLDVSYQVRVNADGERGDNELANFLFEDGQEPPTVCTPADLCTTNPVPQLVLTKSADPTSGEAVEAGEELTYTLTFDNTLGKAPAAVDHTDDLSDVLDDATFVAGSLTAQDGLTATGPSGDAISIAGEVPAGAKLTVSYRVIVNDAAERGNNTLANFLLEAGEDPGTCEPGDPCTTHPVSQVSYKKLISAPTPPVVPGSVIRYVIEIQNTGTAAGTVARVDDLSDVLDDADLTGAPESDTASVTVSGPTNQRITIGGTLAAGATAYVSYEVTVKEVADQGNHQAINFLLEPGTEPPTVCDPDTEQCTITEWPNLEVQKTSDPEPGTVLHAGDEVTYTLSFSNSGTEAAAVDHVDHRDDVLDAAAATGPATATAGLQLADPDASKLAITGSVAPGETETVSYTVRVLDTVAGGERLTNFLTPVDGDVPGSCEPASQLCTDHPIVAPGIDVQKTAKPGSGTAVADGQLVTYALRFWNWSPATAPIAYEDLLAGVLDDATLETPPTITAGDGTGVTVAFEDAGGPRDPRILVTSDGLAPNQEFVVTYQVRVDLALGGDRQLGNFVVEAGEDPDPETCEPGDWHCTVHPAGKLDISKSVDPSSGTPVTAGQELTYTLHFANTGTASVRVNHSDALAGVLDDADWNDELAVAPEDGSVTARFDELGERIAITGELAGGASATVTYTVTVKADGERGDNELGNFLLAGNPPIPPVCDPDSGDVCTTNPVPDLVISKTADPATGTPVATGEELTYTLTFDNSAGKAPATVDHSDDLSDVLDDATFADGSLTADAGLAAAGPDAGRILITGSVPAGETRTVSYRVTVKPEAERLSEGNNSLANFLFAGDEPPEVCEPGDPCTVHPAPNLQLRKSVDPESLTTVSAGETLSYTLTFDNSAGTAPATVDHRDDVSGVLDDARVVPGSLIADPGLGARGPADDVILVTGEVPAGETLTVRYSVIVKADGERGDNELANFLLAPGVTDPPVTCEVEDPTCTTNPVPEIAYDKQVVASDDPIIAGKTTLSYTVTVTNTGTATGPVARTDDLSDVLDDATVAAQPRSDTDSVTVTPITDDAFTIGGELAAGATAKITYAVTVKPAADQGNHQALNFLLPPGLTEPPVTCEPGNPECTETLLPAIAPAKSATHAGLNETPERTWLRAGEAVTYTLTFTNDGSAPGPVSYWDGLQDVLTYASLEGDIVVAQEGESTLTAVLNEPEDRIDIAGTLAAGQTATVTYTMRLAAELPHGARVTNYLIEEGGTFNMAACFPGEGMICTDHPAVMPGLDVSKSADPASGTEVREGDEITYTLHFDAWGPDRSIVKHSDILSDVVDDAELLGAPVVAVDGGGGLKAVVARGANGEARIDVLGTLEAGSQATVTYTVRVLPDRDRPATPAADGSTPHQLANFVVGSGVEPPTVCEPGASDCTTHPVETKPDIEVAKSVDPEHGTAVAAGDRLKYTLTFANLGSAAGELDFEDRLADVLDDAELVSGPGSSLPAVAATLDGDVLRVTGELLPRQTVQVTYEVRVKAEAAERPSILTNFVVAPGDPTPEVCDPAASPCTANPVTPKDPTQPTPVVPHPPLSETGGASTLPWVLGGAGLVLVAGLLLALAARRRRAAAAAAAGPAGSTGSTGSAGPAGPAGSED